MNMIKMKDGCVALFFLFLVTSCLHAEVLFHENFSRGRETQNPPESLAWFAVFPEHVSVANGRLVMSGAKEGIRSVIASFPDVTLGIGDRLTLSFDFQPEGEIGYSNSALRVGIYASEALSLVDGEDPQTDASGYLWALNHVYSEAYDRPGSSYVFFERMIDASVSNPPKLGTYTSYKRLGTASGMLPGYCEAGEIYNMKFYVEVISENTVLLGSRISGGVFADENDFELQTEGTEGRILKEFNTLIFQINASEGHAKGGFPKAAFSNIQLEVSRK